MFATTYFNHIQCPEEREVGWCKREGFCYFFHSGSSNSSDFLNTSLTNNNNSNFNNNNSNNTNVFNNNNNNNNQLLNNNMGNNSNFSANSISQSNVNNNLSNNHTIEHKEPPKSILKRSSSNSNTNIQNSKNNSHYSSQTQLNNETNFNNVSNHEFSFSSIPPEFANIFATDMNTFNGSSFNLLNKTNNNAQNKNNNLFDKKTNKKEDYGFAGEQNRHNPYEPIAIKKKLIKNDNYSSSKMKKDEFIKKPTLDDLSDNPYSFSGSPFDLLSSDSLFELNTSSSMDPSNLPGKFPIKRPLEPQNKLKISQNEINQPKNKKQKISQQSLKTLTENKTKKQPLKAPAKPPTKSQQNKLDDALIAKLNELKAKKELSNSGNNNRRITSSISNDIPLSAIKPLSSVAVPTNAIESLNALKVTSSKSSVNSKSLSKTPAKSAALSSTPSLDPLSKLSRNFFITIIM